MNMLKRYHGRGKSMPVAVVTKVSDSEDVVVEDKNWPKENTLALSELDDMLKHLDERK